MEALAELAVAILTLFVEATFHALVFIFWFVVAAFSPRYRKRLKDQWDTSTWQRIGIVLGVMMYSAALALALCFWIPVLLRGADESTAMVPKRSITIKFSDDEVSRMQETKKMSQLVETAGSIIKRKLAEQKQEAETQR